MLSFIRNYFRNLALRQKLLFLVWLSLVLLSPVAMIGFERVTESYSETLYRNIANQLSYSAQTVSEQLQNIGMASYMVYKNETIHADLIELNQSLTRIRKEQIETDLFITLLAYYERFRTNHVSYIDVYCDDFSVSGNLSVSKRTPEYVKEEVRKRAREAGGESVWVSDYGNTYGLFLTRQIKADKDPNSKGIGEYIICIDIAGMIRDATQFGGQYEKAGYLLLDQNNTVFCTDEFTVEHSEIIKKELTTDYNVIKIDGHSYFAEKGSIPRSTWEYVCVVSYDKIARQLDNVKFFYGAILIICVLIIALLLSIAVGSLDKQFRHLIQKMTDTEKSEWSVSDTKYGFDERNDEIGVLNRQFGQMNERLKNLTRANYINEILKKEAQLKALENQINPHFLYNTLESINWRAKAVGAEDISTMAQSLGALLRVTLSKSDNTFTLSQEIGLVSSYISILSYRFEDRLHFVTIISEDLLDVPFPKLTLQPLVENAVQYGLEENTEECDIIITAEESDGVIKICVKNSGSSFEPDILLKLQTQEISSHGHGIALLNIDERLKLTFGEEYGLTLYNEDELAVACVTIPLPDKK